MTIEASDFNEHYDSSIPKFLFLRSGEKDHSTFGQPPIGWHAYSTYD